MDERRKFVSDWFNRAQESMDDFEKFIFLWLCLIIVLKAWSGNNGIRPNSTEEPSDGWYVNKYFSHRYSCDEVIQIFENHPNHRKLATRKSASGDYVVSSSQDDTGYFSELYKHFKSQAPMTTERKSAAIGRLLKAIRNNLFHGEKLYDSSDDLALLALAAPLLEAYVVDAAMREIGLDLLITDSPNDR